LSNNLMNVIEAEFAFRMQRDLPPRRAAYALDEVMAAVASLHPAIEVPDSRYLDFVSVGAAQLIADNACASYFVLGAATKIPWREHELARHRITVQVNGKVVREGRGDNVLGDPRLALTWIANELSLVGDGLRNGDTITTGTCIAPAPIAPGDVCMADFGDFGKVEAAFVA
jgi:2-keto-4-pentenoate hydratase